LRETVGWKNTKTDCGLEQQQQEIKLQIERNRRELVRRTRRKIAMQSNNNKKENCKLNEIVTN
jgi:hypothetical protein